MSLEDMLEKWESFLAQGQYQELAEVIKAEVDLSGIPEAQRAQAPYVLVNELAKMYNLKAIENLLGSTINSSDTQDFTEEYASAEIPESVQIQVSKKAQK